MNLCRAQRAPAFANGGRDDVALRQKIATQTVANLAGLDAIAFFFFAATIAHSIKECATCNAAACGLNWSYQPVNIVAPSATVHGFGSVLIQ
jgi:hypothetical protein